jgi:hypothetical protein
MMREKSSYSFLRSLVKGQDHSFFKDLTGSVFCTVGGTLVYNRTNFFGFGKFKYHASQSGGFDPPCTPSFLNLIKQMDVEGAS